MKCKYFKCDWCTCASVWSILMNDISKFFDNFEKTVFFTFSLALKIKKKENNGKNKSSGKQMGKVAIEYNCIYTLFSFASEARKLLSILEKYSFHSGWSMCWFRYNDDSGDNGDDDGGDNTKNLHLCRVVLWAIIMTYICVYNDIEIEWNLLNNRQW